MKHVIFTFLVLGLSFVNGFSQKNTTPNLTAEQQQLQRYGNALNRLKESIAEKNSESIQKAESIVLVLARQQVDRLAAANNKRAGNFPSLARLDRMVAIVSEFEKFSFVGAKEEDGAAKIQLLEELGAISKEDYEKSVPTEEQLKKAKEEKSRADRAE